MCTYVSLVYQGKIRVIKKQIVGNGGRCSVRHTGAMRSSAVVSLTFDERKCFSTGLEHTG